MPHTHTRTRWGGVVAAATAAVLAVPLSAMGPAHAIVDRADVSITKSTMRWTSATIAVPDDFAKSTDFNPAVALTRSRGHVEVTPGGGLRVWTDESSSLGKAAEYVRTNTRLADVGAPSLDYTPTSGQRPGYQLVVDLDNNGDRDAILVGEYGIWWAAELSNPTIQAQSPQVPGPGNTVYQGPLANWQVAFPNARVQAFGFSLGSGVLGDGIINAIDFAGTRYTFSAFGSSAQAAPGETLAYRLEVTNTGTLPATGVVVTDTLPAGLTPIPSSLVDNGNGCSFTGQTLTCNAGTFPTGSTSVIRYHATLSRQAKVNAPATAGHAISTQVKEATLALAADASAAQTVACDPGYVASDGGLYVDPIADGFYSDLLVTASGPTADNTGWTVRARNYGDVPAGGKVYVNCLNELLASSSGHTHAVQLSAASIAQTSTAYGRRVDLTCPSGTRPIAPAFETESGVGFVRESYPHTAQMWRFIVDYDENASMTYSARCLADETTTANGHTATLGLASGISTLSVPAETRAEGSAGCPTGKQAVVGGYSGYDANVLSLGKRPTGAGYSFRFFNEDWETAYSADMLVTCVGTTTTTEPGAVVNTATVSTTELEQNLANNSSSATVKVVGDPETLVFVDGTASRYAPAGKVKAIDIRVRCVVACTFGAKVYKSGTVIAKATKSLAGSNVWRTVRIKTTDAGKNVTAGTVRVTLVTSEGAVTANPVALS